MRSYCVRSIRLLSLLFVCLSLSQLPVAAADQVLVGASGMKGIQLDTWASGEIPAIAEGQALRLSRLHFDSCTGVVLHNNGGATLIYAESSSVRYAYQGGESYPNTELAQGQAIIAQPGDFLTIINPMVDPAFSVDLLILSVTEGDSSVDVPMIPQFEFPDDSACNGINAKGLVTPTILGDGHASESGDTLYLGSAFFFPGSTTAGWGLINPGSSFNMV
ncbi:MAG TPA: hypothetical protein PK691_06665, partial [Thermomicrobiales bacterium]|nr:hypothetical protein [Thermomicrobiales bacterium]